MNRFLNVQEVINIHDLLIMKYGGLMGLRDLGLLSSAVETPKAQIDRHFLHKTVFDKAAAYLFHICKNHPFLDGNKRTAAAASLVFLEDNKVQLAFKSEAFEELVLNTAKGMTSKKNISSFFKEHSC